MCFSRENKRQTKMEIDWKMEIMLKIDNVLRDQNLQLYDAFSVTHIFSILNCYILEFNNLDFSR